MSSGILMQSMAETRILEFKLDKIRNHINSRLNIVDPICRNELSIIMSLIEKYEVVPADWKLETSLVTNIEGE